MKFRYKVLVVNLILLSVSLGIVGYLMIRRNFDLAQGAGLSGAIMENNLIQSSVEYDLLRVINNDGDCRMEEELQQIGSRLAGGMMAADFSFYIRYANKFVYASDGDEGLVRNELFDDLEMGEKNYVVCEEGGRHHIYVTSCSMIGEDQLCVINKWDVSENYEILEAQTGYFRMVIVGVLLAVSFVMYIITRYLTNPLENLTRVSQEIARGDYSQRVAVRSGDEVGQLAGQFNCMAAAVEERVAQLEEMVRSREQFVADFTHEIKTPMTTIIGYADTMRSVELSRQEELMSLNYIFSEGKRLEEMSGKLFELIYLKKNDIGRAAVHVEDLVRETGRITMPALERKGIALVTDVEPGVVYVSRELMVTVFINLIDNARKASEEGGEIRLGGRWLGERASGSDWRSADRGAGNGFGREAGGPGGRTYEFTVADHGVGMTEEEVRRMCDEFYMADKSRARKEGGAGLGMALVAVILERHGAAWDVASEPGKGTVIRIVLDEVGHGKEDGEV